MTSTALKITLTFLTISPILRGQEADHAWLTQADLRWMVVDLKNYAQHFEPWFERKLARIRQHQEERQRDLDARLKDPHIRDFIPLSERLTDVTELCEIHQVFGGSFVYRSAEEFETNFIGPRKKWRRSPLSDEERRQMNRTAHEKTLFVDPWSVPFFDEGTQTREEARRNVQDAVRVLSIALEAGPCDVESCARYLAIFARPEFDDMRRFKLQMFPTKEELRRFGHERNDAAVFGERFPKEIPLVRRRPLDIAEVSVIFGMRVHYLGLISHGLKDTFADGRVFTGPADFLEHDFAHAFFNLAPSIPGSPADWEPVHRDFSRWVSQHKSHEAQASLRLIFYHLTHESGFKFLKDNDSDSGWEHERRLIKELLATRYHYDFFLPHRSLSHKAQLIDEHFAASRDFFAHHYCQNQMKGTQP